MPNLCIICATNIANDPRVLRQIHALKADYDITVLGRGALSIPNVQFFPWEICHKVSPSRSIFIKRCLSYYIGNYKTYSTRFTLEDAVEIKHKHFDIVLVNEAPSLIPGFILAKGAPVVCDLHENYLEVRHPGIKPLFRVRYLRWLCKTYLPQCEAITTVSKGLADLYEPIAGKSLVIVPNCPPQENLLVQRVNAKQIRLIHHGLAEPTRQTHLMIEMMDYLDDRFTLDLMLTGNSPYHEKVYRLAKKRQNVFWREPVPMPEICKTINQYDIGVFLAPPNTYNLKYCLPNKFFEFVQARLGIAIGPSLEMAPLVLKHGLGVVSDDFTPISLAKKLNSLSSADIQRFKQNCDAQSQVYHAEASMQILKSTLKKAI